MSKRKRKQKPKTKGPHKRHYNIEMIKIACLRNKNKRDDFTEIVARNRGANFRLFTDEYEAINWLKD